MAVTSAAPILENAANFLGQSAQAAKRVPLSAIAGGLVGAGTYVHRRKEGDTQVEAMLSGVTTGAAVAGLTHLFTEKTGVFSRWGERAATAERTAVENTTSEQVARARGMAEAEASRGAESQLQKDAAARGQSTPVDEDIPNYDFEAEQAEQARRSQEAEASATSEPAAQEADTIVSQEVSAPSSPVQEVTPTATQAEPVAQAAASEPTKTENQEVNPAAEPIQVVQDPAPRKTEEQMLNERVATMAQGRKSLPLSTVEPAAADPIPAAQPTSAPTQEPTGPRARTDSPDWLWHRYERRSRVIRERVEQAMSPNFGGDMRAVKEKVVNSLDRAIEEGIPWLDNASENTKFVRGLLEEYRPGIVDDREALGDALRWTRDSRRAAPSRSTVRDL